MFVHQLLRVYTEMDITCLHTSSWEFICDSLTHSECTRHVGRNYVPLLCGVDTDLRYYVIRDCYLNTVVPLVDTDLRYYVIRDCYLNTVVPLVDTDLRYYVILDVIVI